MHFIPLPSPEREVVITCWYSTSSANGYRFGVSWHSLGMLMEEQLLAVATKK